MTDSFKLGTRGSALALAQSGMVARMLENLHPGLKVKLEIIRTLGDVDQKRPLVSLGRTGVFTAELERALLDGSVDFAVHSLKDLPTTDDGDLTIAAIPERENPRDALVLPASAGNRAPEELTSLPLPRAARIGTSSLRRKAHLLHARPDLNFSDLRGNVDTRLRKLDEGQFDACIFAAAGLKRLGLVERAAWTLHPRLCSPDPGQGALAVQTRSDRDDLRHLLSVLDHPLTRACVLAERALLAALGGGCSAPIGALAVTDGDESLRLSATVADPLGESLIRGEASGPSDRPVELGNRVADQMLESGAEALLSLQKG